MSTMQAKNIQSSTCTRCGGSTRPLVKGSEFRPGQPAMKDRLFCSDCGALQPSGTEPSRSPAAVTEMVNLCGCTGEELEAGRSCGQEDCPNQTDREDAPEDLAKICQRCVNTVCEGDGSCGPHLDDLAAEVSSAPMEEQKPSFTSNQPITFSDGAYSGHGEIVSAYTAQGAFPDEWVVLFAADSAGFAGKTIACQGRHLSAVPALRVLDVRYMVVDDGEGGADAQYAETDAQGAPVPHSETLHTFGPAEIAEGETIATWAAAILRDAGTTQNVGSWWADPDGASTLDHGTGEQSEMSAHPSAIEPRDVETIDALLSADPAILDAATHGFVRTLLWSSAVPIDMGENGETGGLEGSEPTDELTNTARGIVARFLAAAGRVDIDAYAEAFGDPDNAHSSAFIGHTFYLDAAGSGVSFMDRAWKSDDPMTAVCERLADVAKTFREVEDFGAYEQADGTVGI